MSDRLLPEERISPEQTAALLGGDEGGQRSLITNPAPSSPLSIADVPDITAPWPDICEFALSFDGYRFARGSREWLMFLADRQQDAFYRGGVLEPMPLNELRAALFFEQRNYRWNETEPGGKDLRFVRALIAEIANQVREGGAK